MKDIFGLLWVGETRNGVLQDTRENSSDAAVEEHLKS